MADPITREQALVELYGRGKLPKAQADAVGELIRRGKLATPDQKPDNVLGAQAGFLQPLDRMAQGLEGGLKKLGVPTDAINHALGTPSAADVSRQHAEAITRAAASGRRPGALGEFAGNVAITAPTVFEGPLVGGALAGAALSKSNTVKGTLADAGIGMAGGKLGQAAVSGAGRVLSPVIKPAVQKLLDLGVPLTPGQIGGGMLQMTEDRLAGLPVVGDVIKAARDRATQGFSRGVVNETLAPIGAKLPAHVADGHDAVAYAGDQLSTKYQSLLPKLNVKVDARFAGDVNAIRAGIAKVPQKEGRKELQRVLDDEVLSRFNPQTGQLDGRTMKEVDGILAQEASSWTRGNPSPHDLRVADGINAMRDSLRALVTRSNPQQAPDLKALNTGWAKLVRVEKAAGVRGSGDGVFTPAQLGSAARQADNTARKRAVGRGEALMQDLAKAGQEVLGQRVPDSGTAGRSALAHGMGYLATGGAAAMAHNPAVLMAALPLIAYTKGGQQLIAKAMTQRGPLAGALAKALPQLERPAVVAGRQGALKAAGR